ncbi:hypothetical protein PHMEG_00022329 [Phytophthora megakarya]|uniref:Uncharacterized protein n=1 Tax=Phytophthora megakarya TaxID=4795 RepID=A0A225VJ16_9STRA|nr:hypothetical protein PHMEG_00022329 [Phytophthora megakarya]
MEDHDWEKLQQTVQDIRENIVNVRSRATYSTITRTTASSLEMFVTNRTLQRLGDTSDCTVQQLRARIKELVTQDNNSEPLKFDDLTAKNSVTWIVTLERKDRSSLSFSALNTHRAGRFNLFRDFGHTMSKALESELTNSLKGLKHKLATDAANGDTKIKTGKALLMDALYSFLCKKMLVHSSKEIPCAHAYMVIAWNLMCRLANAFVTLGLYWAMSDFDGSDLLFPGSNQYERFRKCWMRLLCEDDVAAELRRQGLGAEKFGTR